MSPISNFEPAWIQEMADIETGWDEIHASRGLEREPYLQNLRRYPSLDACIAEHEGLEETTTGE